VQAAGACCSSKGGVSVLQTDAAALTRKEESRKLGGHSPPGSSVRRGLSSIILEAARGIFVRCLLPRHQRLDVNVGIGPRTLAPAWSTPRSRASPHPSPCGRESRCAPRREQPRAVGGLPHLRSLWALARRAAWPPQQAAPATPRSRSVGLAASSRAPWASSRAAGYALPPPVRYELRRGVKDETRCEATATPASLTTATRRDRSEPAGLDQHRS
jgi:hypothetical protein